MDPALPTISTKISSTLSEEQHQHPFFRDLVATISDENSPSELVHEKPIFENKMRPTFSFIKKGKPHVPQFCVNVVQIQLAPIDAGLLGKTLAFNEYILASNPKRSFIVSMATNLEQFVLFSSRRDPESFDVTEKKHSRIMDFWTDGLRYANLS